MENGVLPKLSEVFNRRQPAARDCLTVAPERSQPEGTREGNLPEAFARASLKAQAQWRGAIAALESLLLTLVDSPPARPTCPQGLLLSAPAPVLSLSALASRFYSGIFSGEASQNLALMPLQLPAVTASATPVPPTVALSLLPADPLAGEQFCLALTPWFSLLMVLGEDSQGLPAFEFSFEPEVVQEAWNALRSRLSPAKAPQAQQLDALAVQFPPTIPDYRLVMHFSREILQHLPTFPTPATGKTRPVETPGGAKGKVISLSSQKPRRHGSPPTCSSPSPAPQRPPEAELLQALTHEIRTPLTTIRTMTRLLLRNKHLTPQMVKQLEAIDQECTEQIDRMELIFRAIELETAVERGKTVQLVPMSLEQILQRSIPRWQKQAQRRHVSLEVVLPQKLPQVISDPALFDRVLAGLMEKFTHSLPPGGQIRLEVTTAGSQLKLQFHTQSSCPVNPLKALGQLLMFQPETGSLSLNLNVTKNLFQALGGKLIVRQRSQQGEVFTIFFPLTGTGDWCLNPVDWEFPHLNCELQNL